MIGSTVLKRHPNNYKKHYVTVKGTLSKIKLWNPHFQVSNNGKDNIETKSPRGRSDLPLKLQSIIDL